MGKRRTLSAAMWRRPLGNPVEYAASSPTRPIALPIFCSISQSRPPPTHPSVPPRWSWETTSWRHSKLRAKPSVVNVNDEWPPFETSPRLRSSVPTDRDRSPCCRRYSPKIVVVNEYIFRSRAWFNGSITILSFLRCPTLMMIGMIRLIIEGNEKNVTIFNLQFCILKEIG